MHRLFAAIRPPRAIRERLLGLMGGVHNARWQSDDQLHLTLRFIGEVDRHRAEDVAAALGSLYTRPFELALSGAGQFGEGNRAGSLWIGVTPQEPVARLHKKIDQACVRAGIPPEGRAYIPHITVARLGRTTGRADDFLATASAATSELFLIDNFCLFESTLGSEGASYVVAERYSLG